MSLHGAMISGAADTLHRHGWTAFQDPWIDGDNGGYPLFHVYPHFAHQSLALPAMLLGVDPWAMLALGALVAVLLLPLGVFVAGRWLGLEPTPAAFSALVAATLRSEDAFGHSTLCYGFDSSGMFAQLWGMAMAPMAFAAWVAASKAGGAGLGHLSPWARGALASMLVGLVLRTHLPSVWILGLTSVVVSLTWGTVRGAPWRMIRFAAVGAVAATLSAGYLVPFLRDLDAIALSALEHAWKLESVGAGAVLGRLLSGAYLDGGGGPWTLLLLATLALVARRGFGEAAVEPRLRALAVAFAVLVLALFGRETWGDWVGRLPLIGRFHDHRYLLGVHLLAPLVLALGGAEIWRRVPPRFAGSRLPVAVACVGIAWMTQGLATWADARAWSEARPAFGQLSEGMQPILDRVRESGGRLAVVGHGSSPESKLALAWAQRQQLPTAGQSLHHYAPQHELALFWQSWIDDIEGIRNGPIHDLDLRPLGVTALVVPPTVPFNEMGPSSSLSTRRYAGGWRLLEPTPPAPGGGEVMLVRSDLLARADPFDLDGFSIGCFVVGLHHGAQYPSIDAGPASGESSRRYERVIDVRAADPGLLVGLPATTGAALGRIHRVWDGTRPAEILTRVEVSEEGTWLLRHRAWHPRWRASIDGEPAAVTLLTPGVVGVALPPGAHEVASWWHVPRWRGWWAAINVAVHGLGFLWVGLALWKSRHPVRPGPNSER